MSSTSSRRSLEPPQSKKELEILLEGLEPHPHPEILLEQYSLPAVNAAEILWNAQLRYGDIAGRVVLDLGCGTGILAIGAALLGASRVIGVDVDCSALKVAVRNALRKRVCSVDWICGDARSLPLRERVDTVVQNPPFGVKKKGADTVFLEAALSMGEVVYSIHKAGESNRRFLEQLIERIGGRITDIYPIRIRLPPTYPFHHKRAHFVNAEVYRIIRRR